MSDRPGLAVRFLTSMAQALATMSLYAEGHPARARAAVASFDTLRDLQQADPRPSFSFLGSEVIFGQQAIRGLADWEWATKLANVGIQRLEFADMVDREAYVSFLEDVLARVSAFTAVAAANAAANVSPGRGNGPTVIRFGAVGVRGSSEMRLPDAVVQAAELPSVLDLNAEVDAIRWVHEEVNDKEEIPLLEAESIVRSLSVAMHGDSQMLLPLLQLKEFDQYTTTHALNVSVLSMGLAEFMGLSAREVRAYGVAGMLHDLGKVRVPKDILTKAGKLTPEEWSIMRSHTVEGARLILQSDQKLDVAALVAFEHHIMINGGGYPDRHFRCDCHKASTLVHVCDVYDALRTKRPYRDAWEPAATLTYIERGIGTEFDADVAKAFIAMMGKWEPRLAYASLSPAAA
ncbi:MAG TPA: HD domain-containing phosphohydrolase [Gemmatimonadaceae bacterium]|nr:HD domain-containing phosphohydrolase [Gemmatimonadaceae bacterium]